MAKITKVGDLDASGGVCWLLGGIVHRDNGPAREWANGNKFWCQYGEVHRLDGPARIFKNDLRANQWWVRGNHIPDQWIKENIADQKNVTKAEQVLMLLTWG